VLGEAKRSQFFRSVHYFAWVYIPPLSSVAIFSRSKFHLVQIFADFYMLFSWKLRSAEFFTQLIFSLSSYFHLVHIFAVFIFAVFPIRENLNTVKYSTFTVVPDASEGANYHRQSTVKVEMFAGWIFSRVKTSRTHIFAEKKQREDKNHLSYAKLWPSRRNGLAIQKALARN